MESFEVGFFNFRVGYAVAWGQIMCDAYGPWGYDHAEIAVPLGLERPGNLISLQAGLIARARDALLTIFHDVFFVFIVRKMFDEIVVRFPVSCYSVFAFLYVIKF